MNAISLDATDCRILNVLQNEGRISNLDLAERIVTLLQTAVLPSPVVAEQLAHLANVGV